MADGAVPGLLASLGVEPAVMAAACAQALDEPGASEWRDRLCGRVPAERRAFGLLVQLLAGRRGSLPELLVALRPFGVAARRPASWEQAIALLEEAGARTKRDSWCDAAHGLGLLVILLPGGFATAATVSGANGRALLPCSRAMVNGILERMVGTGIAGRAVLQDLKACEAGLKQCGASAAEMDGFYGDVRRAFLGDGAVEQWLGGKRLPGRQQ